MGGQQKATKKATLHHAICESLDPAMRLAKDRGSGPLGPQHAVDACKLERHKRTFGWSDIHSNGKRGFALLWASGDVLDLHTAPAFHASQGHEFAHW
jgi:hypothetical protein